jgi:hypothetical protein
MFTKLLNVSLRERIGLYKNMEICTDGIVKHIQFLNDIDIINSLFKYYIFQNL